jgi:hypothetical protein
MGDFTGMCMEKKSELLLFMILKRVSIPPTEKRHQKNNPADKPEQAKIPDHKCHRI